MDDNVKIPVTFKGEKYIWIKYPNGSGPLAYPSHFNEDGELNVYDALFSDSFAHVNEDGVIKRYREQIGTVQDLITDS